MMHKLCEATLRAFNGNDRYKFHISARAIRDGDYVLFRCTRRAGHEGQHGWCQGLDTVWTFQWGD